MVINQGDIFWVDLNEPSGSEPGYRHPHVVIQNNLFNRSRINTVVVCALTSNLKRAKAPGNVLLNKGEANLPKKSVVNISQIFTVNKSDLSEKIGTLPRERFNQVLEGIKLLSEPREVRVFKILCQLTES
jgi:mRNA interferase MazF